MASKNLIDIALKLSKELGANTNKFLGSRTNISFLGKGPKDDLLFQSDLNVEALPAFPLNKLMPQIESSMGYLTGGKLNDIQATKLISNLEKIKEFNFPTQTANIIDLGTGTRNLTEEGLGALRATRKTDDDVRVIQDEVGLGDPLVLIKKYFGDTITKRLPLNSDRIIIEEFVDNVRFTKDKAGFRTDDPRFNPDDLPEFKHGGLAKILEV
jgi:hypothetical protein